jgi:hypothetical protein
VSRQAPVTLPKRPAARRVLAWVYTGPLGHLWAAVADVTTLWLLWAAAGLRERYSKR